MSTDAWRRGQLVAGSGGHRRTCDLRAGAWLTEFEKRQYSSAGSSELRAGSVVLGGLFSRRWN